MNKKTTIKKKVVEIDYEKLAQQFQGKESLPYSMSGAFDEEDVVAHKTFGRGVVLSVSYQRMEVAFSGGPRTLACNR